ncbi:retron St85 family RNA-directed DNA polymerase [Janthinobacterium kumbetense]|uniref:RNA-directed DNA polymerase n=1 Tax=Janthinobacterium kumbetense TaxID=2950280 RepID=A0ABT0WQE9_9BURK|nr:retron St85 family RNA-directed DNA polymerase [Janthinobacterium kumbetense]MCM2566291.1 retron St85 family RNA-directed DNA polymerase [Janthinobacterium kumbetense]
MSIIDKMMIDLPFSSDELIQLISTARYRYKVFQIPKRQPNKFRTIAQPSAEIKIIQCWLMKNILSSLPIHQSATAYRQGLSIGDHATTHAGKRFLLKLDFSDFFPSISANDVQKHLTQVGKIPENDAQFITRAVCWYDRLNKKLCLSIGAPSSPLLSNSILYDFDRKISQLLRGKKITYSRYADDLAFSTNRVDVLSTIPKQIQEIADQLSYPRLRINHSKTVSTSRACRQSLVGLILTPTGDVSLGRDKKRRLRSELYRFSKGLLNEIDHPRLRGELAFAWSIEPSYILSLVRQFGTSIFRELDLPFGSEIK